MFGRLFQTSWHRLLGISEQPELDDMGHQTVHPPAGHGFTMTHPPASHPVVGKFDTFEHIYRTAPVNQPQVAYSVLKVAEMVNSQHLVGMSTEVKRAAILMALETAGAEPKDILQDAMLRQRALNDYEEMQQKILQDFETAKAEDNRNIQAELDRITSEYMARVQANVDEVARHQDNFRAWQKSKQQEMHTIAEASSYCAISEISGSGISVMIERAAAGGRR